MKRNAIQELVAWKSSEDRKPMVLKGARQVGKTWLMKEFGQNYYDSYVYFNFDEEDELKSIFETNKNPQRIIELLSLIAGEKILPGKTLIIFDEIQALPIKMVHHFCGALNFLLEQCGATVLLCTATQPLLNGVSKDYGSLRYGAEDEIIPDARMLFESLKRVEIKDCTKIGGYSIGELGDMAIEKQQEFISILAIVNTTAVARKLYVDIRSKLEAESAVSVVHLSALMCPDHRKVVLDGINERLKAGKPIICVSTQVMEAGIDVDFGSGIRSLAGFDSIVQAAGRCNREGQKATAPMFIVNPADENLDRLIDIKAGRPAWRC